VSRLTGRLARLARARRRGGELRRRSAVYDALHDQLDQPAL